MSLERKVTFPLVANLQIEDSEFSFEQKWRDEFYVSKKIETDQVYVKETELFQPELECPQENEKLEQTERQCKKVISEEEKKLLYQNNKEVPNCNCFALDEGKCLDGKPPHCNSHSTLFSLLQ